MLKRDVINKIRQILIENPETRDDDRLLIARVWQLQSDCYLADYFFQLFLDGDIANPCSITRNRRKLQEANPSLRGKKWEARHKQQNIVPQKLDMPSYSWNTCPICNR